MIKWSEQIGSVDLHLEALRAIAEQLERIATAMENPPEYELPEPQTKVTIPEKPLVVVKQEKHTEDIVDDVAFEKAVAEIKEVTKIPLVKPEPKAFRYRLMQIDADKKPIREPNFIIEADTFEEIKVLAKNLTEEKGWGILWTSEKL
jgi:hypothetical protein